MPRRKLSFSDQLRREIEASPLSQLAVGRAADMDRAPLSRFMNRKAGLRLETIDRLCELLDLELRPRKPKKEPKR